VSYLAIVLQWLHVGLAAGWFGAVICLDAMLYPVLGRLQPGTRAEFLQPFAARFRPLIAAVAGLTILTGIARGLVLGLQLNSGYGVTFVAAIVVAVFLAAFGARVLTPALERSLGGDVAGLERVRQLALVELAGFLLIFTMMIGMRFGY